MVLANEAFGLQSYCWMFYAFVDFMPTKMFVDLLDQQGINHFPKRLSMSLKKKNNNQKTYNPVYGRFVRMIAELSLVWSTNIN